ncbi:MAG: DUF4838 domain-containing protein [Armatimonadota bacterium]|nr:MAG: DUF4838 domain-containing protein [Armatimonadota bacterium]
MARKKVILVQPIGFHSAVEKAADELASYLPRLADVEAHVLPALKAVAAERSPHIVLGVSDDLSGIGLGKLPKPHDLDDALAIIPRDGRLYLTGSNPRSVLFAAYRLLEELGAVFLRPGPDGEVLPRKKRLVLPQRPVREIASCRHRGLCIEGAPRLEHVLDLLDWMAKKKMNGFQLQFRHSGVFWRRGYGALVAGAAARTKRLTEDDCLTLDDRVIARVKELGMLLHRVGHGWTAYAVGLPGLNWEKTKRKPPKGKQQWLAQVNGKRDVWEGVPLNTELCYADPEARRALVAEVVEYARRHPEVDILHFWLSDAMNNKCECARCRRKTPSDWYAVLVNEVSSKLKAEGISTRVLFLAYLDLLRPPERERITGDNVAFMFAPITRCFRHALADTRCAEDFDTSRPALNRCRLPRTNRGHADLARMWKKLGLRDTFLFDYHLGGAGLSDGLGKDIGAVMARDIRDLDALGLNGYVGCHHVRVFYPLPYLPNVMADMLWNTRQSVPAHRRRIMSAAFGSHAREVEEFFAATVRAFRAGPDYGHGIVSAGTRGARRRLSDILALAEGARRRFAAAGKREKDGVVRQSLGLAAVHAEHIAFIARAHLAALDRNKQRIAKLRADYEIRLPKILQQYGAFIDPMIAHKVRGAFRNAERAAGEREA